MRRMQRRTPEAFRFTTFKAECRGFGVARSRFVAGFATTNHWDRGYGDRRQHSERGSCKWRQGKDGQVMVIHSNYLGCTIADITSKKVVWKGNPFESVLISGIWGLVKCYGMNLPIMLHITHDMAIGSLTADHIEAGAYGIVRCGIAVLGCSLPGQCWREIWKVSRLLRLQGTINICHTWLFNDAFIY